MVGKGNGFENERGRWANNEMRLFLSTLSKLDNNLNKGPCCFSVNQIGEK